MKIKGQNFRAFINGDAVAEATNCQVTITGNMEDASTKDTEGMFTEEQMVSKSWQVQVECYDVSSTNVIALKAAFAAGETLTVSFDQTDTTSGTQNRTPSEASFARSGEALLTDVNFQFNDRSTATVSLQFQGSGDLS